MSNATKPIVEKLTPDVVRRFEGKYEISDNGCHEWRAIWSGDRYGRFAIESRLYLAHRVALTIATGADIAQGLEVDHLCRNPRCVNPDHLEAVTHRENIRRGNAPSAATMRAVAETGRCVEGHDMTAVDPWYTRPNGDRECRQCLCVGRLKDTRSNHHRLPVAA